MASSAQKLPIEGDQSAWKLFVFSKKRNLLRVEHLISALHLELEGLIAGSGSAMDALVRAGELETGLADAQRAEEHHFARVTDVLAAHASGHRSDLDIALRLVQATDCSGEVACSHPEGFSYYGLNPLDYADMARWLAPELRPFVAVIGIRSVGSVLGAIVAAALNGQGKQTERISIRPEGEPYNRRAQFNAHQLRWIRQKLEKFADFLIVDEGPGFSGSTLLSVARALESAGVPETNIRIICSRPVEQVHDPVARAELTQYKAFAVGYGRRVPPECDRNLGGGLWREAFYTDSSEWPANWSDLERIKHLSVDGSSLFKFEGFGRFGALAREHAQALAEAGFSPRLLTFDNGFAEYEWISGRHLHPRDLSRELLGYMAGYCSFRAARFSSQAASNEPLRNMMQRNLEIEFQDSFPVPELPLISPVYPDCRLMPHEWLRTSEGRIFKTDSVGHAEGHQLPGPVDIAWDLAGVIVEWELSAAAAEFFLSSYKRQSGDDAERRIDGYVLAYLIHRVAYCRMGAASMQNCIDGELLLREYQRHSGRLRNLLHIDSQTADYPALINNMNLR